MNAYFWIALVVIIALGKMVGGLSKDIREKAAISKTQSQNTGTLEERNARKEALRKAVRTKQARIERQKQLDSVKP